MGNLCSAFGCLTENVTLTTPFGSCSCGKSVCGCIGGKNERESSDQLKQQELAKQINDAVKTQIGSVEQLMKTAITNNLNKFGVMPIIHILEKGVVSPPPSLRALTVRVTEPMHIVENVLESEEMKDEIIPIAMKLMELL